jgi:hypothetical protein
MSHGHPKTRRSARLGAGRALSSAWRPSPSAAAIPPSTQAVRDHGVQQGWGLGVRPLHADDHVIGQAWLWVYDKDRDPAQIAPLEDALRRHPGGSAARQT